MQPFSPWPVRFCLVGVAGLTLGAPPFFDFLTLTSYQPVVQRMALGSQEDDRGSGRLWQPGCSIEVSFRGSGRVDPNPQRPNTQAQTVPTVIGFRGSGRVDPNPQRPNTQAQAVPVAYRGSGRIQPQTPART